MNDTMIVESSGEQVGLQGVSEMPLGEHEQQKNGSRLVGVSHDSDDSQDT